MEGGRLTDIKISKEDPKYLGRRRERKGERDFAVNVRVGDVQRKKMKGSLPTNLLKGKRRKRKRGTSWGPRGEE